MSILGTLRLEHVENFYLAKQYCPQVKLVVAEDNEAVIKIIKKADPLSRDIHTGHTGLTLIGCTFFVRNLQI